MLFADDPSKGQPGRSNSTALVVPSGRVEPALMSPMYCVGDLDVHAQPVDGPGAAGYISVDVLALARL